MSNKNLLWIVLVIAISGALLFVVKNNREDTVEEDVEEASNAVSRVVNDGKDALRSVAEGVNDAVYK